MPEIQGKKRALTGLPSRFQVSLDVAQIIGLANAWRGVGRSSCSCRRVQYVRGRRRENCYSSPSAPINHLPLPPRAPPPLPPFARTENLPPANEIDLSHGSVKSPTCALTRRRTEVLESLNIPLPYVPNTHFCICSK